MMYRRVLQPAFTLAELLIALAILGVIATFTIPKILDSGSDAKLNAVTLEAVSMVSQAYQMYKKDNTPGVNTGLRDFTQYMNYVRIDSVQLIDNTYNNGTWDCALAIRDCMVLHNGAIIRYSNQPDSEFGHTATTSATWFGVDPDGKVTTDGTAGTPGKSVQFWFYINGRVTTVGHTVPGTYMKSTIRTAVPAADPPWFSWSNQ